MATFLSNYTYIYICIYLVYNIIYTFIEEEANRSHGGCSSVRRLAESLREERRIEVDTTSRIAIITISRKGESLGGIATITIIIIIHITNNTYKHIIIINININININNKNNNKYTYIIIIHINNNDDNKTPLRGEGKRGITEGNFGLPRRAGPTY